MADTYRTLRGLVTVQGDQKVTRPIIIRSLIAIVGAATTAHLFAPGSVETDLTTFGLIRHGSQSV